MVLHVLGSADAQAAIAGIYNGMREKSEEFLAKGAKVYLPEPQVPRPAGTVPSGGLG